MNEKQSHKGLAVISARTRLLLLPILLMACSLANNAGTPASPPGTEEVSLAGETPTKADEPAEVLDETPAPTDEPDGDNTGLPPGKHPLLIFPGIVEMENLMPESGVGIRPRLEWQAVDGAAYYDMVIFEADGTPYWSWRTEETGVYVAGIDEPLPEENEGPIIADGMSWQVVAYDSSQAPVGAGGPWPIGP